MRIHPILLALSLAISACDQGTDSDDGETDAVVAAPIITEIAPLEGTVGTTVTVTGTDLDASDLSMGGQAIDATTNTATQITFDVPTDGLSGDIVVTTDGGSATGPESFVVIRAPQIASVSPAFAMVGETLTLSGSAFSSTPADNTVVFLGAAGDEDDVVADVTSATETELRVQIPQGVVDGPIGVTVQGLSAESADDFDVIVAPMLVNDVARQVRTDRGVYYLTGSGFGTEAADIMVQFIKFPDGEAFTSTINPEIDRISGEIIGLRVDHPAEKGLYSVEVRYNAQVVTFERHVVVYDWLYIHQLWDGVDRNDAVLDKSDGEELLMTIGPGGEPRWGQLQLQLLDAETGAVVLTEDRTGGRSSGSGVYEINLRDPDVPAGFYRGQVLFVELDSEVEYATPISHQVLEVQE